ncbi:MAG TPA: hypothetical protein VKV17_06480 [Bryobacteraceae bacterium]|nr:hypothetical protein [Bryobacteraceae bacterium]
MTLMPSFVSRRMAAKRLLTAGAAGMAIVTTAEAVPQPHMQAALRALRNAKMQLDAAVPDKAGHRARAMELVNQAIAETEEGIAAGNKL